LVHSKITIISIFGVSFQVKPAVEWLDPAEKASGVAQPFLLKQQPLGWGVEGVESPAAVSFDKEKNGKQKKVKKETMKKRS
jgi:hypothetical protein